MDTDRLTHLFRRTLHFLPFSIEIACVTLRDRLVSRPSWFTVAVVSSQSSVRTRVEMLRNAGRHAFYILLGVVYELK